ncbi:MAG: hypothetical protein K6V97_01765 [Actinomycetia bacterium]|nr:hypothetical protein [Actinomycetes bacterium]
MKPVQKQAASDATRPGDEAACVGSVRADSSWWLILPFAALGLCCGGPLLVGVLGAVASAVAAVWAPGLGALGAAGLLVWVAWRRRRALGVATTGRRDVP